MRLRPSGKMCCDVLIMTNAHLHVDLVRLAFSHSSGNMGEVGKDEGSTLARLEARSSTFVGLCGQEHRSTSGNEP